MAQKLIITIPSSIVIDAAEAAPIIAALSHGRLVTSEGWGVDKVWKDSGEKPTIELIDEKVLHEVEEPIKKLTKEMESANSRWYEQYVKTQAAEKEVKELKAKLEAITAKVAE